MKMFLLYECVYVNEKKISLLFPLIFFRVEWTNDGTHDNFIKLNRRKKESRKI